MKSDPRSTGNDSSAARPAARCRGSEGGGQGTTGLAARSSVNDSSLVRDLGVVGSDSASSIAALVPTPMSIAPCSYKPAVEQLEASWNFTPWFQLDQTSSECGPLRHPDECCTDADLQVGHGRTAKRTPVRYYDTKLVNIIANTHSTHSRSFETVCTQSIPSAVSVSTERRAMAAA